MIPIIWVQEAPQPPPSFTLERMISVTLEKANLIKVARRTEQIDQKRTSELGAGLKPSITASGVVNRYDQATRIKINPESPAFTALQDHSETFSVILAQRIDLFGQVRASTTQSKLQELADRFATQTVVRGKRLQAETAFFSLLKARDQISVANAALAAAKTQLQQAETLFAGGIGQKVDVLRASTAVAQAEQGVETARNAESVARATFNDLVKLPLETEVALETVPTTPTLPEESTVHALAEKRDDVLQAETLARAAAIGVSIAQTTDKPTLALQASGNYYPTTSFQFPRQRTAAVGLSVSIPLVDGGLARARTDEARLRQENAQNIAGSVRSGAVLEARQAYLNLKTALKQIETTKATAEQARATRDLAQVRYAGQVGLFLELSDAQNSLVRAENAAVDALYDYYLARARFESAIGDNTLG